MQLAAGAPPNARNFIGEVCVIVAVLVFVVLPLIPKLTVACRVPLPCCASSTHPLRSRHIVHSGPRGAVR